VIARLHAGWLLGTSLINTLVRRAFSPESAGLARFHSNYDQDGLCALTPKERLDLPPFSHCIACGLCDQGLCMHQQGTVAPSIMRFVLSSSRSIPDYDVADELLLGLDDRVLLDAEMRCPTHVPLRKLKAFVAAKRVS
jgi:hypothetical protein